MRLRGVFLNDWYEILVDLILGFFSHHTLNWWKEKKENLEKKRQISQMYQYYNYLIFEKNKESFNDINPDLRKMTYKYDSEVKNAYMTVQASPEVIKAAMGMN